MRGVLGSDLYCARDPNRQEAIHAAERPGERATEMMQAGEDVLKGTLKIEIEQYFIQLCRCNSSPSQRSKCRSSTIQS